MASPMTRTQALASLDALPPDVNIRPDAIPSEVLPAWESFRKAVVNLEKLQGEASVALRSKYEDLRDDLRAAKKSERMAADRKLALVVLDDVRESVAKAEASADEVLEKAMRLPDGLELPRVDFSKVYGSDEEKLRSERGLHAATAATARLLARQAADRIIDAALQHGSGDRAKVAEALILGYRGALTDGDPLIVNTLETYGLARVKREVAEGARDIFEDEVMQARERRLSPELRLLKAHRKAIGDIRIFLSAVEGAVKHEGYFLPQGQPIFGHIKGAYPAFFGAK